MIEMTTTMTISNTDWTLAALVARYGAEFAGHMHAWLTQYTDAEVGKHYHVDGWTFVDGAFTGPATETSNLPGFCASMIDDAADYAGEEITGKYRGVIGADGCGCPLTAELDRTGHQTEGSERAEHRTNCYLARV